MSAMCEDNYVVTCNPAPGTPASEVVVHRSPVEQLPGTGGPSDPTLGILGVVAIIIGAFLTITGRRTTRPRRNP